MCDVIEHKLKYTLKRGILINYIDLPHRFSLIEVLEALFELWRM